MTPLRGTRLQELTKAKNWVSKSESFQLLLKATLFGFNIHKECWNIDPIGHSKVTEFQKPNPRMSPGRIKGHGDQNRVETKVSQFEIVPAPRPPPQGLIKRVIPNVARNLQNYLCDSYYVPYKFSLVLSLLISYNSVRDV